jgi:ketosteroid isomerase-like protein
MSHSKRIGLVALVAWGLACKPAPTTDTASPGGESGAGLSAQDEAAIRGIDSAFSRAFAAGDGNALAALYTSDATVRPPNAPLIEGAAVKEFMVGFTSGFSGTFEFTPTAIEGRGDLAYTVGSYRATLTERKSGAKPFPTEVGKYITVVKKQPDGSWKMVYDIWNLNTPAGTQ